MTRRLLCTDLDRTLLPNGEAPESAAARAALALLIERAPLALAYVSGRSLALVQAAIDEYELPVPDVIAADVGSSVHHRSGDGWTEDRDWEARVSRDWVREKSVGVDALLAGVAALVPQHGSVQTPFKRSYTLAPGSDLGAIERIVCAALAAGDVHAALLFSHDPEAGVDLLDVMPPYGTKLHAVRHVRDTLGIAAEATLFGGDSGNDLDVLISEVPAVLVANGDDATRHAALAGARRNGHEGELYLARGGLEIEGIGTLNGNYAGGLVEGLLHFHPELGELLDGAELRARLADDGAGAPPESRPHAPMSSLFEPPSDTAA